MKNLLEKLNVTYNIEFIGYDCNFDIHHRKHYKVTFTNGERKYTTDFWDSLYDSYLIRLNGKTVPCNNYFIKGIKDCPIKLGKVGVRKYHGESGYQNATLIGNPTKPKIEDILAVCELSEPPLSFDEFCSEFGYSNDSIQALETHRAVLENYSGLRKVFGEEGLEKVWETING